MRDPGVNLAGPKVGDQHLWNTYVFWARSAFPDSLPTGLIISDPTARMPPARDTALRAILFAAFALEYRLRSVYDVLGLAPRDRDTLWALLSNLTIRTNGINGLRGDPIVFPREWARVRRRLQKLLEVRNSIAHGRRSAVRRIVEQASPRLSQFARTSYNAVIDAIRITNVAIGYDARAGRERRKYYAQLKLRRR